ncbi:MAG: hypothetical protein WBA89_10250 [Microcoleus sp.]
MPAGSWIEWAIDRLYQIQLGRDRTAERPPRDRDARTALEKLFIT